MKNKTKTKHMDIQKICYKNNYITNETKWRINLYINFEYKQNVMKWIWFFFLLLTHEKFVCVCAWLLDSFDFRQTNRKLVQKLISNFQAQTHIHTIFSHLKQFAKMLKVQCNLWNKLWGQQYMTKYKTNNWTREKTKQIFSKFLCFSIKHQAEWALK